MELDRRITQRTISPDISILHALKKMDELDVKSLIVSKDKIDLFGILSIGDIQRAIIKNISLSEPILSILRTNPRVLFDEQSDDEVKDIMVKYRMEFLPVVDQETKHLLKVYFWEDFFQDKEIAPGKQV